MFFDGLEDYWIARLHTKRSMGQWIRDRLCFPWLAMTSASKAVKYHLTPLDMERFYAVYPKITGRLLDIGCGDNLLVRAYGNGVGVDVVDWGHVDVVLSGDGTLPFADRTFDTITILAALNHIPERELLLRECGRILTQDGLLIMTMLTPTLSYWVHRIRHRVDPDQSHRHHEQGEVWGISRRSMQTLLDSTGFQLEGSKRFVWGLNQLYWARKENILTNNSKRRHHSV